MKEKIFVMYGANIKDMNLDLDNFELVHLDERFSVMDALKFKPAFILTNNPGNSLIKVSGDEISYVQVA